METALVSCEWLHQEVNSNAGEPLVIVECTWYLPNSPFGPPSESEKGVDSFQKGPRIPGAVFFDIDKVATITEDCQPHMLPSEDSFATAMQSLGIKPMDRIVIYDRLGIFSAPRAWYTIKVAFGHPGPVAVLDGGLPKWTSSGYPLEDGLPVAATQTSELFKWERNVAASWAIESVFENLETNRVLMFDARSSGRFAGTAEEPRPGSRKGHIPGGKNMPFTELVTACPGGQMQPLEELERVLLSRGMPLEELRSNAADTAAVMLSCGSGLSACVIALALDLVGARRERWALYDGSWCEWGCRHDTPIMQTSEDGEEVPAP